MFPPLATGDDDAGHDQDGAHGAGGGEALAEQDHRRDQREDGIQVHVIDGGDVAQPGHDEIPGHEAGEGCTETQKEQVPPYHGIPEQHPDRTAKKMGQQPRRTAGKIGQQLHGTAGKTE